MRSRVASSGCPDMAMRITEFPCLIDATSMVGLSSLVRLDVNGMRRLRAAFADPIAPDANTTVLEFLRNDMGKQLCRGRLGTVKRNRSNARHVVARWGDQQTAWWTEDRLRREVAAYLEDNEHRPNEQIRREVNLLRRLVRRIQSAVHGTPLVRARGPVARDRAGRRAQRRIVVLEEVAELLEAGGHRNDPRARARLRAVQTAVVLALALGLRTGELLRLRREDIYLPGGRVKVEGEERRLPPWAVAQLEVVLGKRDGLLFPSPRNSRRPLSDLAGLLRRACARAIVTPFTLCDLRRTWQREGRTMDMPRASVRATWRRLRGRGYRAFRNARLQAEKRLTKDWLVLVHGPADRRGARRQVPVKAPKKVRPHQPEVHRPKGVAAVKRPRVAARCRSDAGDLWRPPQRPSRVGRGSIVTTRAKTVAVEEEVVVRAESGIMPIQWAPPARPAPVLYGNLAAWALAHPDHYARKQDVTEALQLGIVYGEARVLMANLQAAGDGQGQDLLATIRALIEKAQELVPGVDLEKF